MNFKPIDFGSEPFVFGGLVVTPGVAEDKEAGLVQSLVLTDSNGRSLRIYGDFSLWQMSEPEPKKKVWRVEVTTPKGHASGEAGVRTFTQATEAEAQKVAEYWRKYQGYGEDAVRVTEVSGE